MEARGELNDKRSRSRPAIIRRSCDPCRARKIACHRGLPCANCTSSGVQCTYSAVAHDGLPKQRINLSAQYEQKIEDIARDIGTIKSILEQRGKSSIEGDIYQKPPHPANTQSTKTIRKEGHSTSICGEVRWDHPGHIIDFVKAVANDGDAIYDTPEALEVLSSLRGIVQALENPVPKQNIQAFAAIQSNAPPLEAILAILKWSKEDEDNAKTPWIPEILPRQHFTEICQKVCFAIDETSEIESIIAHGYLSYTFFEHFALSGRQDYLEYSRFCRVKAKGKLATLPLLLPANLETVAALALGTFLAIENSETNQAWTFVSVAANFCVTLRYNLASLGPADALQRETKERLFWTVYILEKGLSARLGRASNLRDDDITLSAGRNDGAVALARVQARIYDELFSVAGLSQSDEEREKIATALATDLRAVIGETFVNAITSERRADGSPSSQAQAIYLLANLVCQHSCLTKVLRAIPCPSQGIFSGASDECVKVARDCLELHEQCMTKIRACRNDPFIMKRYINWAILHTPFVPFNILFTRAIQLLDNADLNQLNRFAESLIPQELSDEPPTHPHRLYSVMCRAAKLYFDHNTAVSVNVATQNTESSSSYRSPSHGVRGDFGMGQGIPTGGQALSSWYFDNQQMMSLLNENIQF